MAAAALRREPEFVSFAEKHLLKAVDYAVLLAGAVNLLDKNTAFGYDDIGLMFAAAVLRLL